MVLLVLAIALVLGIGVMAAIALRALMNYDVCMPDFDDVI
jgi:hypothetical protein